eukprot:IDg18219t1
MSAQRRRCPAHVSDACRRAPPPRRASVMMPAMMKARIWRHCPPAARACFEYSKRLKRVGALSRAVIHTRRHRARAAPSINLSARKFTPAPRRIICRRACGRTGARHAAAEARARVRAVRQLAFPWERQRFAYLQPFPYAAPVIYSIGRGLAPRCISAARPCLIARQPRYIHTRDPRSPRAPARRALATQRRVSVCVEGACAIACSHTHIVPRACSEPRVCSAVHRSAVTPSSSSSAAAAAAAAAAGARAAVQNQNVGERHVRTLFCALRHYKYCTSCAHASPAAPRRAALCCAARM